MKNNIIIRPATIDDAENIFHINNSEYVRSNSINKEKIDYNCHLSWLERKLNNADVVFFVATDINGELIGSIHFDKDDSNDYFTVSVSIAKEYTGRGFGTYIIQQSTIMFKKIFNVKVVSFVKDSNIASCKAFLRAGYYFSDNVTILNEEYKRYYL